MDVELRAASARRVAVRTVSPTADPLPSWARCPISGDRLLDAVRAPDGRAYGEASLRRWLNDRGSTLPTGVALDDASFVVPDYALREQLRGEPGDEPAEDALCDPITAARFVDPVVLSDGRTYDLSTAQRLFEEQGRSPFSRDELSACAVRSDSMRQQLGLDAVRPEDSVVNLGPVRAPRRSPAPLPELRRPTMAQALARSLDASPSVRVARVGSRAGYYIGGAVGFGAGLALGGARAIMALCGRGQGPIQALRNGVSYGTTAGAETGVVLGGMAGLFVGAGMFAR